jgi:UDP-glucose 4-epimerase
MNGGRWLIVGGAGYIGAHVVRAFRASGREPVVLDDLSTGLMRRLPDDVDLHRGSVLDGRFLQEVLRRVQPTGVVHLAGKKSPAESVTHPLLYARENVGGVVSLLDALRGTGGTRVVFSSSASVYGTPDDEFVDEDAPTNPESPYGHSKLYGERVLNAAATAYALGVINLRYFNVVGAATPDMKDSSVSNLVPLVFRAVRSATPAQVFGADYNTPDGTCIRDYVDVEDLADAHVRAAEQLESQASVATYNVGRGIGVSVRQVLDAVAKVSGVPASYEVVGRRPGDPARVVGRVDRIARELGWTATRDLDDMLRTAWLADDGPLSRLGDKGHIDDAHPAPTD